MVVIRSISGPLAQCLCLSFVTSVRRKKRVQHVKIGKEIKPLLFVY